MYQRWQAKRMCSSPVRLFRTRGLLLRVGTCLVMLATVQAQQLVNAPSATLQIEPMTKVNVMEHIGYFGDPYPIHLVPGGDGERQYFSGTTAGMLQCTGHLRPGCYTTTPLTLKFSDTLHTAVRAAGNTFRAVINHNAYQENDGSWQMAVTLYVHPNGSSTRRWTVIAHAHSEGPPSMSPPTSWVADKILVGSLSTFAYANYDGKYVEEDGKLYLIHSKRLISTPVQHDGIVAQEMTSPAEIAPGGPVVSLAPTLARRN